MNVVELNETIKANISYLTNNFDTRYITISLENLIQMKQAYFCLGVIFGFGVMLLIVVIALIWVGKEVVDRDMK